MNSFEKRKKGFEEKFAHDEMLQFKARARRNRALGAWAAAQMELSPDQTASYVDGLIAADAAAASDDALAQKLLGDFAAARHEMKEQDLRKTMQDLMEEAQAALMEEAG